MSWAAGSNPYAVLSQKTSTQREQPKPKKDLANAKDATKVHKPVEEGTSKPQADPKKGTGNNSAHPNRPARQEDRKGRQYPKHSSTGYRSEEKRDGKDWGEGAKRVEDGKADAASNPQGDDAGVETKVHTDGDDRRDRRGPRRDRGDRGDRRPRERREPELTPEEQAALQAEREAEARQMTLKEWKAKQSGAKNAAAGELKEARKVDNKDFQNAKQVKKEIESEWSVKPEKKKEPKKQPQQQQPAQGGDKPKEQQNNNNNNNDNKAAAPAAAAPQQQQQKKKKKEVLQLGEAPRRRRDDDRGDRDNRGDRRNNNNKSQQEASVNLEDQNLFPVLGGGKKK